VSATIAALPARPGYSMKSGNGYCYPNPGTLRLSADGLGGAFARIQFGINGDGVLMIETEIGTPNPPRDCSTAIPRYFTQMHYYRTIAPARASWPDEVLLCNEPTGSTPPTYAIAATPGVEADASYGDGTIVRISSGVNPGSAGAFTPQQLAAAAADPRLKATIPSAPFLATT
jgi:hypothetical protein